MIKAVFDPHFMFFLKISSAKLISGFFSLQFLDEGTYKWNAFPLVEIVSVENLLVSFDKLTNNSCKDMQSKSVKVWYCTQEIKLI